MHALTVHRVTLLPKEAANFSVPVEGMSRILPIYQPKQRLVEVAFSFALVVVARARQSQQFTLPRDAQIGMRRLDERASLLTGANLIFF